jgi:phospholipase C
MLNRRQFLISAAATSVVASSRPWRLMDAYADVAAAPPFDHVVVLMMENRSFDHFLGWLPGANGVQAGLAYTDTRGDTYPTYDLRNDFQGCGYADPDHSYRGFRKQYNGGKIDGFLQAAAPGDTFPIGYYGESAVPVLGALAREYTSSDRYFASIMAETYPNRFYQHSAATDRPVNTMAISTLPTIWDRLAEHGLSGRYYSTDAPFMALWGTKYATIINPAERFFVDCVDGTLPNVAFVDPAFGGESQGISRDDHPHADVRSGEVFIGQVYQAVRSSPLWGRTILVINYDEWGGFFDHVAPPQVIDDSKIPAETASIPPPDAHQLGFRVPCVAVSPFSPRGRVVGGGAPFDHTSVLRMIEWRWNLPPLTARDAHARNLAEMLDFRLSRTDTPAIAAAPLPTTGPCGVLSVAANPPAKIARRPASGAPGATAAAGGLGSPNTAASGAGALASAAAAAALVAPVRSVRASAPAPDVAEEA